MVNDNAEDRFLLSAGRKRRAILRAVLAANVAFMIGTFVHAWYLASLSADWRVLYLTR